MRWIPTRYALPVALLLVLGLASCSPSYRGEVSLDEVTIENGLYQGTYWITHHAGSSEQRRESGGVWMRLEDGRYQIEGEQPLLPPAGSGNYRIEGHTLVLEDTAMHTADFDWTLILHGRFDIEIGDRGWIRLVQDDPEHGRRHELELRRQD